MQTTPNHKKKNLFLIILLCLSLLFGFGFLWQYIKNIEQKSQHQSELYQVQETLEINKKITHFLLKEQKDSALFYARLLDQNEGIKEEKLLLFWDKNDQMFSEKQSIIDSVLLQNQYKNASNMQLIKKIETLDQEIADLKASNASYKQLIAQKNAENELTKEQLVAASNIILEREKELKILEEKRKNANNILEIKKDALKKETVYYIGEKENDMANGYGVAIWPSGGMYKGQWKDNYRHGKGTYTWKDGEAYEGDFVNGQREGQGKYTWKNGEYYVGSWKNGMRNGEGAIYLPNGKLKFKGIFVNDEFVNPNKAAPLN